MYHLPSSTPPLTTTHPSLLKTANAGTSASSSLPLNTDSNRRLPALAATREQAMALSSRPGAPASFLTNSLPPPLSRASQVQVPVVGSLLSGYPHSAISANALRLNESADLRRRQDSLTAALIAARLGGAPHAQHQQQLFHPPSSTTHYGASMADLRDVAAAAQGRRADSIDLLLQRLPKSSLSASASSSAAATATAVLPPSALYGASHNTNTTSRLNYSNTMSQGADARLEELALRAQTLQQHRSGTARCLPHAATLPTAPSTRTSMLPPQSAATNTMHRVVETNRSVTDLKLSSSSSSKVAASAAAAAAAEERLSDGHLLPHRTGLDLLSDAVTAETARQGFLQEKRKQKTKLLQRRRPEPVDDDDDYDITMSTSSSKAKQQAQKNQSKTSSSTAVDVNSNKSSSSASVVSSESKKTTPTETAYRVRGTFVNDITDMDVLCGRGGRSNHWPGNRRYRQVVSEMKETYQSSAFKKHKMGLTLSIVERVLEYGGRFVREDEDEGCFYVLTKKEACVKTSQALREGRDRK